MEGKGLGKRINMVRKDRGFTADRLSELCDINATYLRQIEGGTKVPSLPVFINICNALKSPLIICCGMCWKIMRSAKYGSWRNCGKVHRPASRKSLFP